MTPLRLHWPFVIASGSRERAQRADELPAGKANSDGDGDVSKRHIADVNPLETQETLE